jgi:hypothetical protein
MTFEIEQSEMKQMLVPKTSKTNLVIPNQEVPAISYRSFKNSQFESKYDFLGWCKLITNKYNFL